MLKKISVLTLGGTIAYTWKNGVPQIGDLTGFIDSLDEVKKEADITVKAFRQKSSSSMVISDITGLAAEIQSLLEGETEGVVVVQGTDTIEETAFALEMLLDSEKPVAVTGAMRNPDMRGADGPANLLAAIRTVSCSLCRELGVMVVFNDAIYPALYVRKIHPQSTEAFAAECGPLGYLAEGKPSIRMKPLQRRIPGLAINRWNVDGKRPDQPVSVPIYAVPVGDDGKLLKCALDCKIDGLVLEAMGGGHTPSELVETLKQLADKMPVVLASRIGRGDMLTGTYAGYPGSETSLLSQGLISSGFLDGRKARLLLILMLMSGFDMDGIREGFRIFSKECE